MCGIFAVLAPTGRFTDTQVQAGLRAIAHRGPDGTGLTSFAVANNQTLWLGHQRLSIVDLSTAAGQPFIEAEDALIFNGEIYNHKALRLELDGAFRTSSDTEVLLRGLRTSGERFLSKLNGMFALLHYDAAEQRVLLARDRLGKKPLYVYESDGVWAIASQPKAFDGLGLPLTPCPQATAYFRWMGYVPAPLSIWKECRKLEPSTFEWLSLDSHRITRGTYWDAFAKPQRSSLSLQAAADEVDALLTDAVRLRLDADVPVGILLSGGIDSSLVAAATASLHRNTQAFTVGHEDHEQDESSVASDTARRLGLTLTKLDLPSSAFLRQSAIVQDAYDEPLADVSQVPMLAVSEAARQHVTVVLTGDGGDELFLGYPWLFYPQKFARLRDVAERLPRLARDGLRSGLKTGLADIALRQAVRIAGLNTDTLHRKRATLDALLSEDGLYACYDTFRENRSRADLSASDATLVGPQSLWRKVQEWYPGHSWKALGVRSLAERFAAIDMTTFMVDDVLTKVDRATMWYGLEARSPFLDYRLVELALTLPLELKASGGSLKHVLRVLVQRKLGVDSPVLTGKKRGFGAALPDAIPTGPDWSVRWNQHVESAWRQRWL